MVRGPVTIHLSYGMAMRVKVVSMSMKIQIVVLRVTAPRRPQSELDTCQSHSNFETFCHRSYVSKSKIVKLSLLQAMEAHKVARG
jgi:hypothetical protein